MAKVFLSIVILLTIFLSSTLTNTSASYYEPLDPSKYAHKKMKATKIHFYLHQITVTNKTLGLEKNEVAVAGPNATYASMFGGVLVGDYLLTQTSSLTSTQIGRAQGISAFDSIDGLSLFMAINVVFTTGKYNGSTIGFMGHNNLFQSIREMPIVGGSRLFRFATGYVETTTVSFSPIATRNVLEYNLYVYY